MTETANQVHQGKYGYYPCSRETFLKLKKLNAALTRAKHSAAAWYRWARKAPQNRVIREYIRNEQGQKTGFSIIGQMTEPKINIFFSEIYDTNRQYSTNSGLYENFSMGYYTQWCRQRTSKTFWINDKSKPIKYIPDPKSYEDIPINADIYRYMPSVNGGKIEVNTFGIDRAYTQARKPQKNEQDIPELDISTDMIDDLYKRCFD